MHCTRTAESGRVVVGYKAALVGARTALVLSRSFQNRVFGFQENVCELQNSACGFQEFLCAQNSARGFQPSACGLQNSTCGLQSSACGSQNKVLGLEGGVCCLRIINENCKIFIWCVIVRLSILIFLRRTRNLGVWLWAAKQRVWVAELHRSRAASVTSKGSGCALHGVPEQRFWFPGRRLYLNSGISGRALWAPIQRQWVPAQRLWAPKTVFWLTRSVC